MTIYRAARLAKFKFSPKFTVVDGDNRQVYPRAFGAAASAERIADQLNAGTLAPQPGEIVETIAEETDIEAVLMICIDEKTPATIGNAQRSRVGGGHDTQIWDES